jgi:NAD(P)-dependent dehydrogenase (short-subunit alcohol dehydrogenase family)
MDTGLKGRTVLITGAGRRMGRLAALMFAKEGANLAICTSRIMKELNQVADEVRALGAGCIAEQCDVTNAASVAAFVKAAHAKFGSVDVAINNAGSRAEGAFLDETLDSWQKNIAVNLTGPFHVCQNVIPLMVERKWGRIINLSGVAPYLGGGAAKATVKLGIVGFTRGLAREFVQQGITANCIGPGHITKDPDDLSAPRHPMGRKGKPEEAVSLMVHLASENAAYITGQCYLVNGGLYFQ